MNKTLLFVSLILSILSCTSKLKNSNLTDIQQLKISSKSSRQPASEKNQRTIFLSPRNMAMSEEIQQHIDQLYTLGGGRIILTQGLFRLNKPLELKSRVWLEGSGYKTIIYPTMTAEFKSNPSVFHQQSGNFLEAAAIRHLRIVGESLPQLVGFYFKGGQYNIVENIWIEKATQGTLLIIKPDGVSDDSRSVFPPDISHYANLYQNISMTEGTRGIYIEGLQDPQSVNPKPQTIVTLNTYRNIILNNISNTAVEAVSWTDHENFENLQISLRSANSRGIVLRSHTLHPGNSMGVNHYKFVDTQITSSVQNESVPGILMNSGTHQHVFLGLKMASNVKVVDWNSKGFVIAKDFLKPTLTNCKNLFLFSGQQNKQILINNSNNSIGSHSDLIQSAIHDLSQQGGGVVRLSPGIFYLDKPINLKSKVLIRGSGFSTVLQPIADLPAIFTSQDKNLSFTAVEDLSTVGVKNNTTTVFRLDQIKNSLLRNILALDLRNSTFLDLRSSNDFTEGNCFNNLVGNELRNGVLVNIQTSIPNQFKVQNNEFRTMKLLAISNRGIQIPRQSEANIWSDFIIWNTEPTTVSLNVGQPPGTLNSQDLGGGSVKNEIFYQFTISMEGRYTKIGNSSSSDGKLRWSIADESKGLWIRHTQQHAFLGFSYTNWHWKYPLLAESSQNITTLNMISEVLRGQTYYNKTASGQQTVNPKMTYLYSPSGMYNYKCGNNCKVYLKELQSKDMFNFGELGFSLPK